MDTQTRVLITGGAGFIGSHLADALVRTGYRVKILDALVDQVHPDLDWPKWSKPFIATGDAHHLDLCDGLDQPAIRRLIRDFRPQCVVHLAAEVGVGQAEYEIGKYVQANVLGTAWLLETLLHCNNDDGVTTANGVGRLIVAGSMSSYGEGMWTCPVHGPCRPSRDGVDLIEGKWVPKCSAAQGCTEALTPSPIPEWSSLRPSGIYALTKRDQEELALLVSRSRGLSTAVTRFFNVYGERQQPSNPYTGVAAIFGSRARRGERPLVFEDGEQARDFVHVSDVVNALQILVGDRDIRLAMRSWASPAYGGVFNVCTGYPTTIGQVARIACKVLAPELEPEITAQYRVGDVRACIGDRERLRGLGWEPQVRPEAGLWALFDTYKALELPTPPDATSELLAQGLLHGVIDAAPDHVPWDDTEQPERTRPPAESTTAWVDPLEWLAGEAGPIDTAGGGE